MAHPGGNESDMRSPPVLDEGANANVGAVAIGRNEGERLRSCLRSLVDRARPVVYVDSGSTDGSGVAVVEFEPGTAFTAARARNLGLSRLCELAPEVTLVQFVDGDCEVAEAWWRRAREELLADPSLAVVCGRRRERYPDASPYNRLCDLEWDTPVGDADACGGDALMRVEPVRAVGGYNPTLIAGEEPDLCLRLRRGGWRVRRIDAEMTLHDAAMTTWRQWWRRTVRSGHAYAEGAAMHGRGPERHWVREVRSIAFWGLAVPAAALGLAPVTGGLTLVLLGGYPVLALRTYRSARRRGIPTEQARLYTASCVVGKFPQAVGMLRYWRGRILGGQSRIIEYKNVGSPPAPR